MHGFGLEERDLLDSAAILHDIGTIIGYDGHHRHSQALIETNGLSGYSPREIGLLALLARYHRKGTPESGVYQVLFKDSDPLRLTQLSAILRLAEYLERGRTGAIDDVILTWTAEELRITLIADEYPYVELWQAERNAVPLMEMAFGKKVRLDSVTAPLLSDVRSLS
jgi:exopolyphosphatase/guanosine-5'-triphosphate,3'-diphosphate pyrophosphatase